ncbi:MAG: PAS domain S-box protein [Desulfobacterales bacterium]|jgi:PAS domain S-box-containing protein
MQKQALKALMVIPNRDDFMGVQDLLHQIKKWRFEVQWEPDPDEAARLANESSYDFVIADDSLDQGGILNFLDELEKEARATPVILLISNHEHVDDFEAAIAKTAGYLEKASLYPYKLEHMIRYAVALEKATEQIRESQTRLRSIFYGAAIGIALLDIDGQIIETNPGLCKLTGYSEDEICTFFLKDFFVPQSAGKIETLYSEMVDGQRDFFQIEERFNHEDGTTLWLRLTASLYIEDNTQVKFAVALFEDTTERKKNQEALRASSERMRELSRKILDAQENERKLVAQEIHDSIGGSLAAIKFALEEKLESMGHNPSYEVISLEKIISQVDETIKESRRISAHLRPSLLDDIGLLATISWFCREFEKLHPTIQIEQQLDAAEHEIPEMLKVVVYRVLQEAMNNVAKHSDASRVLLHLTKRGDRVEFSIADDGCGFDPEEKFSESTALNGLGLASMKDRTILCDGNFELSSGKGQGTKVHISLPIGAESIGGSM